MLLLNKTIYTYTRQKKWERDGEKKRKDESSLSYSERSLDYLFHLFDCWLGEEEAAVDGALNMLR